jgi:AcrR family transcriptional regulator
MMVTKVAQEPRTDPRVTRTQNLIRDALKALLSEKSFESISVQDIAERATVNRATFYAHFQDKVALLDALIRADIREHLVESDPMAADTRSMLVAVGTSVFGFVTAHRKCKIDRDFEPQFERAMEAEVSALLAPRFSGCIAHLIGTALVGSAMRWRASGRKEPSDGVVREIVDALYDGVAESSG